MKYDSSELTICPLSGVPGPEVGITNWGSWTSYAYCSTAVVGFKLQSDHHQIYLVQPDDYTSLNGIQLLCEDLAESTKLEGPSGTWDETWSVCAPNQLITKIAVRGTIDLGDNGDDYGATNVKAVCSDGHVLERNKEKEVWRSTAGGWTHYVECPQDMKICGVRAKIDEYDETIDNTA